MPVLRLLSYNIRSLRDDKAAVARVIRSADPHVVCIQEAPRFFRWRAQASALARATDLVVVTGGRPAAANLILSSLAVDVVATKDVKFTKEPRLHQRGTAMAVCRLAGSPFAVAGIHLDLEAEARLRHASELHAAIDAFVPAEVPAIICGDVNEGDDAPAWMAMAAVRPDAWATAGTGPGFTSTAKDPHQRIDGVFVDPRITVRAIEVIGTPDVLIASDHRPIYVELELP